MINKDEYFLCYTNALTKYLVGKGYFYVYRYMDKESKCYVNMFRKSGLLDELLDNYETEKAVKAILNTI